MESTIFFGARLEGMRSQRASSDFSLTAAWRDARVRQADEPVNLKH
jgi:hypothetical protein